MNVLIHQVRWRASTLENWKCRDFLLEQEASAYFECLSQEHFQVLWSRALTEVVKGKALLVGTYEAMELPF